MKKCLHAHTYTHFIHQNIQTNIKLFRGSNNPSTVGSKLGAHKQQISCIHGPRDATNRVSSHQKKEIDVLRLTLIFLKIYMFDHNCILVKKNR